MREGGSDTLSVSIVGGGIFLRDWRSDIEVPRFYELKGGEYRRCNNYE